MKVGLSVSTADPMVSEALACCGADIVWMDMEHAPLGKREVLAHITAVHCAGASAFVRLPAADANLAKPVLDMGADALVFPMVSTAEEAGIAAACMCYPPEGTRGYGPLAANKYGEDADYALHARERLLCCVQLETGKAVEHAGEICAVSGIDAVIIGSMDLSYELGCPGRFLDGAFVSAVREISCQARRAGIKLGCFAPYTSEALELYGSVGVDFFLCSGDLALMTKAAREMLSELRGLS